MDSRWAAYWSATWRLSCRVHLDSKVTKTDMKKPRFHVFRNVDKVGKIQCPISFIYVQKAETFGVARCMLFPQCPQ